MYFTANYAQTSIKGRKPEAVPNQDVIAISDNEVALVVSIADGLGTAPHSLTGAQLACDIAAEAIHASIAQQNFNDLDTCITSRWTHHIETQYGTIKDYRTTHAFVAVSKTTRQLIVGRLGDLFISLRIDGQFKPIALIQKEFLNETASLGSGNNDNYELATYAYTSQVDFLLATDGIGDEIETNRIEALHEYMVAKYSKLEPAIRNEALQQEIEASVGSKNNDDKSIVITWSI
jgi:serine/threonine protein phosphatase PrpC